MRRLSFARKMFIFIAYNIKVYNQSPVYKYVNKRLILVIEIFGQSEVLILKIICKAEQIK